MKNKIKNLIRRLIGKFEVDLVKINNPKFSTKSSRLINTKRPYLKNRLANLIRLGFESPVIVDGGAHIGSWTKAVSKFFPDSKYILIEPNPMVYSKIIDNLPNGLDYTLIKKALGTQKGSLELNIWGDIDKGLTGSSLCKHIRGEATNKINCEIIELDSIIDIYKQVPNLIKLDLQGYEIYALKGAKEILKSSELMIIEFGCLDAYIGRTSINDLINIMYENSYCLYDIIDIHYRPYDNALTGGDFVFVKNSSKLRQYKGWA